MWFFQIYMQIKEPSLGLVIGNVIIVILLIVAAFVVLKFVETIFMSLFKRPIWVHFYIKKKKLKTNQKQYLTKFSFYNKLSTKEKTFFEHRVASFIEDKEFIGRDGAFIDDEKRVLLSATAIMLTFGMRNYLIPLIEKIIVYPEVFYSVMNDNYHKGEFNPMLKALVLSWKDFEDGFANEEDNLNLGIHEFTHSIHFNALNNQNGEALIFLDGFSELEKLLVSKEVKERFQNSDFFRDYAFTNKFEFIAVVLENFIESPEEFKRTFPLVYKKIRQMLNFRFAGY